MSSKTTPIAGRINQEDYDFLMSLSLPGATTQSERLRAALSFFRRFHTGTECFHDALGVIEALVGKGRNDLLAAENETQLRSDFVHVCLNHVPSLLALLASFSVQADAKGRAQDQDALRELEEKLLFHLLPFIESILRLVLTKSTHYYNPSILKGRLDGIRDAASALAPR